MINLCGGLSFVCIHANGTPVSDFDPKDQSQIQVHNAIGNGVYLKIHDSADELGIQFPYNKVMAIKQDDPTKTTSVMLSILGKEYGPFEIGGPGQSRNRVYQVRENGTIG